MNIDTSTTFKCEAIMIQTADHNNPVMNNNNNNYIIVLLLQHVVNCGPIVRNLKIMKKEKGMNRVDCVI